MQPPVFGAFGLTILARPSAILIVAANSPCAIAFDTNLQHLIGGFPLGESRFGGYQKRKKGDQTFHWIPSRARFDSIFLIITKYGIANI
ncbi:MAG: hypothetical protein BGP16_16140 [Sphingobium sp. 66-54]|nr:MAG: hypothetical protein BGP16_16140 [Sphingobium sp. 66-54]